MAKCGETTHCLIYDTDAMRNYLAFFPAAFIFLALLSDAANFHYSKGMKFMTMKILPALKKVKSSKNLKKKDSKKLI